MKTTKTIIKCDECQKEIEAVFILTLPRNSRTFKVTGYNNYTREHGAHYDLCKPCTKKLLNDFTQELEAQDEANT